MTSQLADHFLPHTVGWLRQATQAAAVGDAPHFFLLTPFLAPL